MAKEQIDARVEASRAAAWRSPASSWGGSGVAGLILFILFLHRVHDLQRLLTSEGRIERVTDPADPRLRDFTELRDVQLRAKREPDEGFFLAEGAKTIQRALAAGYEPRAFLVTERWLPSVREPARLSRAPCCWWRRR